MTVRAIITTMLLSVAGLHAPSAWAADPASYIAQGRELAEAYCGRCHAIGRTGESPLATAPPFRTLGKRYPVEQLAEALAEGIVTGHPDMPEFTFEPDDIGALLAYLEDISNGLPRKP